MEEQIVGAAAANDPGQQQARLAAALAGNVPQVYFNGFVNALGTADLVAVLERNGQPVAVLNMSYTTAKTLARLLAQTIAQLEERTGRDMLTTQDVELLLAEKSK